MNHKASSSTLDPVPKAAPSRHLDSGGLGLRRGAFAALALTVYGLVFRWLGLPPESAATWLFYVGLAALAWSAQFDLRRLGAAEERAVSFLANLRVGSVVSLLGAAGYGLFVAVYNGLVDDSLIRQIAATVAEQGREMPAFFLHPMGFALMITLQLVVFSVLASCLGAIVFRRRAPNLE